MAYLTVSGAALDGSAARDFAAGFSTDWFPLKGTGKFYLQVSCDPAGSPVGSLTLEFSADGTNYVVRSTDTMATAPYVFEVLDTVVPLIRVTWTRTSGAMNNVKAVLSGPGLA